jgi:hypothetical protein
LDSQYCQCSVDRPDCFDFDDASGFCVDEND